MPFSAWGTSHFPEDSSHVAMPGNGVQVSGSYPQTHDRAILKNVLGRLPLIRPEAQHHAKLRRGSAIIFWSQGRLSPFQVSTASAPSIPACAIRAFISAMGSSQVMSR